MGAAAMSVQIAFGAPYIKQRLGISDEETVLLIQASAYFQYILGLTNNKPFGPSIMAHFSKRFTDEELVADSDNHHDHGDSNGSNPIYQSQAQMVIENLEKRPSVLLTSYVKISYIQDISSPTIIGR